MVNKGNNLFDLLGAGLNAASTRSRVIAQNIANVNTPGYRRKAVNFENLLAEEIDSSIRRKVDIQGIEPEVYEPRDTQADANGNDVDMEVEVGSMIKNSARYKTLMRLLSRLYTHMEMAMQDR